MEKLLLLSVVVALVAIPVLCAKDPNPRRGLKRALMLMGAYNVFYAVYLKVLSLSVR